MARLGAALTISSALAFTLTGASPALAQAHVVGASAASGQATTARIAPPPAQPGWQVDTARYRWIDDADALLDAIGDSPPDFAFEHTGGEAWGWSLRTGHEVFAEPLPRGSVRYYYFEPEPRGRAHGPFLVQDDGVSFGYQDGRMVVTYGEDGRALDWRESDAYGSLAARLYARGRSIRAASLDDDRWDAVDAGWWAGQIGIVVQLRQQWAFGRSRHPGWRGWQARPDTIRRRGALTIERGARRIDGDRFRLWQQQGFRGPAPRFGGAGPGGRPAPGASQVPGQVPGQVTGRPGGWTGMGVRAPRQGWRPGGAGRPDRPDIGVKPERPGADARPERPVLGERPGRPGMGARPTQPLTAPTPPVTVTPPDAPNPPVLDRPQRPQRPDRDGPSGDRRDDRPGGQRDGVRPPAPPPVALTPAPAPVPQVQPATPPRDRIDRPRGEGIGRPRRDGMIGEPQPQSRSNPPVAVAPAPTAAPPPPVRATQPPARIRMQPAPAPQAPPPQPEPAQARDVVPATIEP